MATGRRENERHADMSLLELDRIIGIDVQEQTLYKSNARSRPLLFVPEPSPVGPDLFGILSVQIPKPRPARGHQT